MLARSTSIHPVFLAMEVVTGAIVRWLASLIVRAVRFRIDRRPVAGLIGGAGFAREVINAVTGEERFVAETNFRYLSDPKLLRVSTVV